MIATRTLATLAVFAALYFGSSVLIPLTLGFFLFVLLDPLVDLAARVGVRRVAASLILTLVSIIVCSAALWGFYGAFSDIAGEVPAYSQKLRALETTLTATAQKIEKGTQAATPPPPANPNSDVQKVEVVQGYSSWGGYALKGLGTVFEALTTAFFIPLIALFFLLDRERLARAMTGVLPTEFKGKRAYGETVKMLRSFFVGNMIIGGLMAICLSVLYSVLGLHNAISLGIATGFLNLIPLAGPLFSLGFPILQGLLQFNTLTPFLIIAITVIVLHLVVSNVIVPKVVGSHINVNALAGTIGLLIWGWLWGAVGLLLAVPLVALLKIAFANQPGWESMGRLFSGDEQSGQLVDPT